MGRALGNVLFAEVRCKYHEELAARGKSSEPVKAQDDLLRARERLEVARSQTYRGEQDDSILPLLTEDQEYQITQMLHHIGDAEFKLSIRERLARTALIHEKVHEHIHTR